MTKAIIRDRLLVSGAGTRHNVRDLERRCKAAGFRSGRTGDFGIGVLSYFMLADRVEVTTRRSLEPGDAEAQGWHFATEGVGSFGELRKDASLQRGTEVRLHLQPHAGELQPGEFYESLRSYLASVVTRVPCTLRLHSPLPDTNDWQLEAGWASSEDDWWQSLRRELATRRRFSEDRIPIEQLSAHRRRQLQETARERQELEEAIHQSVRWVNTDGELPNGIGTYRFHLPVFSLDGGESLVFMRLDTHGNRRVMQPVGEGLAFYPSEAFHMAWKGMAVASGELYGDITDIYPSPRYPRQLIAEVDWVDSAAGLISVDRQTVELSEAALQALDWLGQEASNLLQRTLEELHQSPYAWLSYRYANVSSPPDISLEWARVPRGGRLVSPAQKTEFYWSDVPFPAVPSLAFIYEQSIGNYTWRRRKVNIISSIPGIQDDDHYDGLSWHARSIAPDRIMWREHYETALVPLWEADPRGRANTHAAGIVAHFPPEWANVLCGVRFMSYSSNRGSAIVWNPAHALVQAVDAEAQSWATEAFAHSLDPIPLRSDLMASTSRAAAWLMRCLSERGWEVWEGLEDREAGLLAEVGGILFGSAFTVDSAGVVVGMWNESPTNRYLDVPAADRWYVFRSGADRDTVGGLLPKPALDWQLRSSRSAWWSERSTRPSTS
jgi:hypothetical protein